MDYYWENRSQIFIPPSIDDPMKGSAYALSNQRKFKKEMGTSYGYDDPDQIAQVSGTLCFSSFIGHAIVRKVTVRIEEGNRISPVDTAVYLGGQLRITV